jgi:hypothetical protein
MKLRTLGGCGFKSLHFRNYFFIWMRYDVMGIANFVENYFVKNHKDDQKISDGSVCQIGQWHFAYAFKTPRPVGEPGSVRI